MKRLFLVCLVLCFFSSKCEDEKEYLTCSDCSNREAVLKEVDRIVRNRYGDKIDIFKIKVEEGKNDCFIISYINIESWNNPLMKGGGGCYIIVSKKDCKIVDYKILI